MTGKNVRNQIMVLDGYPDGTPNAVKCSWCNNIYEKTNDVGHCPRCGGTVNSESSPAEYAIGRIYDITNKDFKKEKVVNREMLNF